MCAGSVTTRSLGDDLEPAGHEGAVWGRGKKNIATFHERSNLGRPSTKNFSTSDGFVGVQGEEKVTSSARKPYD